MTRGASGDDPYQADRNYACGIAEVPRTRWSKAVHATPDFRHESHFVLRVFEDTCSRTCSPRLRSGESATNSEHAQP